MQFRNAEDAKKALEQLNGFELAGRPMKVGHVTERTGENAGMSMLDSDEMDRAGIDLGATGRLQLMAKLAEGQYSPPVQMLLYSFLCAYQFSFAKSQMGKVTKNLVAFQILFCNVQLLSSNKPN